MSLSVASRDPKPGQGTHPAEALPFPLSSSRSYLILCLLWGMIYFAGMFTPALLDDVDTIHAEAAREMLVRHDWVTMYTNGVRYLEKAPLMYWSLATSYTMFGISDWSTRLPLMLGVLALLLATYKLGRYAYGELGGLYAGIVLATSIGPYIFTRFLIPDVLVGLWLTIGYYFFLRSLEEEVPSQKTCWGFAVVCALNVLTKGLIGLVFPLGAIGLYLILTGNLRHLLKLRIVSSTILFLAVAAPWHILAALRNPTQGTVRGFLWFYFVNEHLMRFLNKRVPAGYDTVPLFIFWGLLLAWLLPWATFLPLALRHVPLRLQKLRGDLSGAQSANLLFFLGTGDCRILQLLNSPGVLHDSCVAWDGVAGGRVARAETKSRETDEIRRAGRMPSTVLFVFGLIAFVAGMYLLSISHLPSPGADLAEQLKKNPQDYDLSLGHVLDLTPRALGVFRGPLLGASLAFLLGTGLNWILRRRGRPVQGNMALAIMMVGLFACVHSSFSTFSPILSSYKLAVAIRQNYRPGDVIVVDGQYHQASTLNFYTGHPLRVLHEPGGNLWYGSSSRTRRTCSRRRSLLLLCGMGRSAFLCGPTRRIRKSCKA